MTSYKVHSVRFYNVKPEAIHCMSYEGNLKKLALSRGLLAVYRRFTSERMEWFMWVKIRSKSGFILFSSSNIQLGVMKSDNSIEIWNLNQTPHIERIVVGAEEQSIEGLAWHRGRLFASWLQAMVAEYDLQTMLVKTGTEDGYINIFAITEDGLQYEKLLDKQEGRILCLAWDYSGESLVTGSIDAIRIWNVENGHAVHKMTTGRATNNRETIVWCVAITNDFTIISGDSRGKLCYWDGQIGTSVESYQSHKADVLCLALDPEDSTVYCAGIDPVIATFESITLPRSDKCKWVKSVQRNIHDHDVRALAVCHGKLYSGGVDGYLSVSSYPPKMLIRYPPLRQGRCVTVVPSIRCLLLRYTSHVEMWRLGTADSLPPDRAPDNFSVVPLRIKPVKLLHMTSPGPIRAAAVSPDGKWLAYVTNKHFRLFNIQTVNAQRVVRVKGLPSDCHQPTQCLQFTADSQALVFASALGTICTLGLKVMSIEQTLTPLQDRLITDSIHLLSVSEDGNYIVAADLQCHIVTWFNGKYHCSLPKYPCLPTTLAIHPKTNNLVIVYSDHKIVEYELPHLQYSQFSRELGARLPKQWLSRSFPVLNVAFDTRKKDIIILHDDNTIFVLSKNKESDGAHETDSKVPRLESFSDVSQDCSQSATSPILTKLSPFFHAIKKYKHLVYFGYLSEDEMVSVEVSPLTLSEQLPPTLQQKLFGGM